MARGQRKACAEREERPARGGSNPSVSCTNCETVCGMQAGETSPPNPPIPSPGLAEARMGGDTNRWGGRAAGLRWRAIAGSPAESCVPPHVGDVSPRPGWCLDSRHQKRHRCSFDLPEDAHAMWHATCRRCHSWGTTVACMRRVVDDQTARPCPPRQPVRRQLSLRQPFPGWSELLPGLFVCLRPVTGSIPARDRSPILPPPGVAVTATAPLASLPSASRPPPATLYGTRSLRGRPQQPPPKAPTAKAGAYFVLPLALLLAI